MVRGGRKKFGNRLTAGVQIEYGWRRKYPLSETDLDTLHRHIGEVIRKNRIAYKWFFVSIQVSVLGGLYQLKFIPTADEERTWETQWVSTKVVNDSKVIHELVDKLLDDTIAFQLQNRPAWINRIRVVFLRNHNA